MDQQPDQRGAGLSTWHWPLPDASATEHDPSRTMSPDATANPATNDDGSKSRGSSDSRDLVWTPFYLKKPFLLSLATTFFLMVVALEVILSLSTKHNGLATVQESWYYSWKFGPTMIASLWAQVEHCAVQLIPWYQMRRSEVSAENSILLNYLTPLKIVSLCKSVKRQHWVVSIGTSGSLILSLLIILSTSLLSLEDRLLTETGSLTILDNFNLTLAKLDPWTRTGDSQSESTVDDYAYYLGMHRYNLSRPQGTTSEYAFQSSAIPDIYLGPHSTTTIDVQVFASIIEDCQSFNFTVDDTMPLQHWLPRHYLDEWETWCFKGSPSRPGSDGYDTPMANYTSSFFTGVEMSNLVQKCSYLDSSDEHRLIFSLGNPLFDNLWDVAVLMCKPSHSLSRRTLTNQYVDRINTQSSVSSTIIETLDLGLPSLNITENILNSILTQSYVWHTLLNSSEPQPDISSFMNLTLTKTLFRKVWSELSALAMKRHFTNPADQTVDASVTVVKGRLCVQLLAVRLTEPLLGLLGIGAIAMSIISQDALPRDPGSLGAHALLLARSPRFMHLLRGNGARSLASTRSLVCKYSFSTSMDRSSQCGAIRVEQQSSSADQKTSPVERTLQPGQFWKPISLSWPYRCFMIITPLVFSITLEVLLQISNTHNGLGNVVTGGYQQYTWTYIPTLAVAAHNLLFSTADSTARILHPFKVLTKGNVRFEEMLYDPSSQLSLPALLKACWSRQYAFVTIISTALMTPLLPIFTSGLFTPQPILWEHNVTLQMRDWVDLGKERVDHYTSVYDTSYMDAELLFDLAQFSNMTDPKWKYEGYVFPQLDDDNLRGYSGNNTLLNVTARIPAMQANINCSLEKYLVDQSFSDPERGQLVSLDPPAGCETSLKLNDTEKRPLFLMPYPHTDFGYGIDPDGFFFVPMYASWHFVPEDRGGNLGDLDTNSTAACGDGRPHYWFAAGHQAGEITDEISVVHCTPYVEALYATVTFNLPSLTIANESPVIPDQASVVPFTDFPAAAAIHLSVVYEFPQAIVNGIHGTPLRDLSGQANIERFISSLERTYRSYAAGNLHINYRRALPMNNIKNTLDHNNNNNSFASSPFVTTPVTGTIKDGTRLRLVQSSALTRTLEAILLALAISGAIHVFLEREACKLPMDPGSVLAKMCLLAEGQVWTLVPEGAERWSDTKIERSGLFWSWRFRLGWWKGGLGEEDRFAIDGVAVDGERDDFDSLLCYESD